MQSSVPPSRKEKGRRHLLDLDAPRRVINDPEGDARDLARVQQWVMSTLAVTTILHLIVGLIIAAVYRETAPLSSRIGLNVLAGLLGVIAVATALGIHLKRVLTPWLLIGFLPTGVGLWLTLR